MSARKITAQQLVEQLKERGGGPGHALAFDGDGTLWSGDVGEDVFHAAVRRGLLKEDALPALQGLAEQSKTTRAEDPNQQAELLFSAYQEGNLAEDTACEMMAWCFAGWQFSDLVELAESVLEAAELKGRLFSPLSTVLDWARATGTRTIVVSASPDFVVEAAAKHWHFAPQDLAACSALKSSSGVVLDRMREPVPYAGAKVTAAKRLLKHEKVLAAFGDNSFDLELLRLSAVPVATRPKPALRARLSELHFYFELGDES